MDQEVEEEEEEEGASRRAPIRSVRGSVRGWFRVSGRVHVLLLWMFLPFPHRLTEEEETEPVKFDSEETRI